MYKWGVYEFSDKEIEQIVELVHKWADGSSSPIDCRKFTKQVRQWAENWSLIQKGTEMPQTKYNSETQEWDYPWYVKQWGKNRYYIHSELRLFQPIRYIPQEALWRILKPMIQERQGFSISTLRDWYTLGIEPNGTKYHKDDDLVEMMFALGELSKWGYIIFQHAGSIWQITITEDRAARSEL